MSYELTYSKSGNDATFIIEGKSTVVLALSRFCLGEITLKNISQQMDKQDREDLLRDFKASKNGKECLCAFRLVLWSGNGPLFMPQVPSEYWDRTINFIETWLGQEGDPTECVKELHNLYVKEESSLVAHKELEKLVGGKILDPKQHFGRFSDSNLN